MPAFKTLKRFCRSQFPLFKAVTQFLYCPNPFTELAITCSNSSHFNSPTVVFVPMHSCTTRMHPNAFFFFLWPSLTDFYLLLSTLCDLQQFEIANNNNNNNYKNNNCNNNCNNNNNNKNNKNKNNNYNNNNNNKMS